MKYIIKNKNYGINVDTLPYSPILNIKDFKKLNFSCHYTLTFLKYIKNVLFKFLKL